VEILDGISDLVFVITPVIALRSVQYSVTQFESAGDMLLANAAGAAKAY